MKFAPTLLLIYCILVNKSISIKGKHTKNLHNAEIIYPVRVSNEGNFIEDKKLEQRFKRSKISQEPTIHYKISVKGNTEYIDLTPNSKIFSPGAVLELRTDDSSAPDQLSSIKTKLIPDQQCIYTGKVRAFQDSSVALSTCHGLCGFIRMKRHTFFIEPASYNATDWKGQPHVLYQTSYNENGMPNCAVDEKTPPKNKSQTHRRKQTPFINNSASLKNNYSRSIPLHLETLLVLDNAMIKSHLRNDLENYVLTVLNMAQSLFNDLIHEPSINIELVRILQLLDDTEKLNFREKRSASEVLETFSKWQNLINPKSDSHPYHHDIAILLTGKDICDKKDNCHFLGIAERSGVCKPKRQAIMCKDNGLLLGYTLAHEIAHNLGIEHDTGYNSCSPKMPDGSSSIMSPTITFNSREWTGCSRDSITSSLESGDLSCLEDDPNTTYSNHIDVLPGFIYGADFQCKRLFNKNAMDCSLSEGDCKSLKCQFEGTSCTNTGVPPAPGTSCGQNKWCCDGECVQVGKHPKAIHGGWGSWSRWSTCSRSCGSGISASVRECNNPTPIHGGKTCNGRRKRHKLCSTEVIIMKPKFFMSNLVQLEVILSVMFSVRNTMIGHFQKMESIITGKDFSLILETHVL